MICFAHLSINGKVTGVGFRNWFRSTLTDLQLEGKVRNRGRSVEGVVRGCPQNITLLIFGCLSGSRRAEPNEVLASPISEKIYQLACDQLFRSDKDADGREGQGDWSFTVQNYFGSMVAGFSLPDASAAEYIDKTLVDTSGAYLWKSERSMDSYSSTRIHQKMVIDAALRRGLSVRMLNDSIYQISARKISILFHGRMPDTTSFVSRLISNSKHATKIFLKLADVKFPEGRVFQRKEIESGLIFAQNIGFPVVIKPVTGSGGSGVTSNIKSAEHFRSSWSKIKKLSRIVVEEHINGNDYRILVAGKRFICAARRHPAHVIGDGASTIEELVEKKNYLRQKNPYTHDSLLEINEEAMRELAVRCLTSTSVLAVGEKFQLHSIANIGAGGDSEDVTEIVHPEFRRLAVQAACAVPGVFHAGVDVLAEDISRSPHDQEYSVCEINARPDLALHHFPVIGSPRDAAGGLLDSLFMEHVGPEDTAAS